MMEGRPGGVMRAVVVGFSLVGSLLTVAALSDRPPQFGDSLNGLSKAQIADFDDGLSDFVEVETVADGLGPLFNGRSCGECHNIPVTGGGSERIEARFGTITNGAFDPMTNLGGSLIQDHA